LCFSLTSDGDFKDKCEFAFKLYDLDKDGKISKKEMTQVLEALYDLSGITDRKGPKAPAKKVEDIIRAINAKSSLATTDPAAASKSIIINSDDTALAGGVQLQLTAPDVATSSHTHIELTAPSVNLNDNELRIAAPTLTVDKKDKDKKKEPKVKVVKVKETKEEKAAKKEREKQEKERKKQEKEREKKEKAEKAKLEKELKLKEKKELAALKKAGIKPPPKPAKVKEVKAAKSKNAVTEFITKEQFIEACNTDEGIKRLFVESIFCGADHVDKNDISVALADTANSIDVTLPSVSLDTPQISSKTITLKQTTTTVTKTNDGKVIKETETVTEKNTDPDKTNSNEQNLTEDLKNLKVVVDYEAINN